MLIRVFNERFYLPRHNYGAAYSREVVARAGQPGIEQFATAGTSRLEPRELSLDALRDLQLTRLLQRGRVDPVALYNAHGG